MSKPEEKAKDWKYLHMFPREILELNEEIAYHPILQEFLSKHHASQIEMKFAEISSYVGIIMDGEYTEEMMIPLAKILKQRLISKRTGIIFSDTVSDLVKADLKLRRH